MMKMLLKLILNILLRSQKDSDLTLENLVLRQQWTILKRHKKRPQNRTKDRLFWIMLSRFWSNWQEPLIVVKSLHGCLAPYPALCPAGFEPSAGVFEVGIQPKIRIETR